MKTSSCITLINIIDGEDGISILSIDEQFSKSNSQTIAPTTNWTNTLPQRNGGEVLWKREVITYSDSSIKTLSAHPITGDKGDLGPQGEISIGLGYKVNHTSLTSSNDGELFAHGFTNGIADNVNGWVYFEGVRYTVLVGYLNPGSVYNTFPYSAYIGVRKSSPSKIVAIRFNNSTKTFKFIDSENNYSDTVDESDWFIIGDFKMINSEMIAFANFYNEGKSLQSIKEEELLKDGKLVIDWSSKTINIKALNNQGFVSFNGSRIYLNAISKTFSQSGEGIIIANLNTNEIKFCKLSLGDTFYNNESVKTINFLDYETFVVITTRHAALIDYSYIKIGEFVIDSSGIVKTALITGGEPLESYLQKAFMKVFKLGNISSTDFEDWLEALDLKTFYQTLVVSNLFVNTLLANNGQFLNTLRISSSNIKEGTVLNDNIDKPSLFEQGILLNQDGSMQANWEGLDAKGYPLSGWKIDGSGRAYFNGATIIGADIKGITAEQIIHKALRTKDQATGQPISLSIPKNEWMANNFLEQLTPNNLNRSNYNISLDGKPFDYFLKTNNTDKYYLYDDNDYSTRIEAGDNDVLHTWTNTFGYPVFVEAQATLVGTMNEIVWEIINGDNPRSLGNQNLQIIAFVLFPNETLQCRGHSWAWFGYKYASVKYVKFYETFKGGRRHFIELNNRRLENILIINSTKIPTNSTILSTTAPAWVDYLYVFVGTTNSFWKTDIVKDSYVDFYVSINSGSQTVIYPVLNDVNRKTSYFKIDCREYKVLTSVSINVSLKGDEYLDGNKNTHTIDAKLDIEFIDIGHAIYLPGNPDSFALFDTERVEKKYLFKDTYYKNSLIINSLNSSSCYSKINKADFIQAVYNSLGTNLQDKWLVTDETKTNELIVDNSPITFNRILISSSSIQIVDANGNIKSLITDIRYNSLSFVATFVDNRESIETGDILPIQTNRIIGTAEKPYQSANINVVNATELHGKVYAS